MPRVRSMVGVLLLLGAGPARAEMLSYDVDLRGANEVPPNDSPGSGKARITFDTDTRAVTWAVTYSGLTGAVTGAHFHGATDAGRNAGIVIHFRGSLDSPITGSTVLTEAQAADFQAGRWYVNVHTARHPGGELRGQVVR